jgi:Uma2 family endonuclease
MNAPIPATELKPHPLSVDDLLAMVDAGSFATGPKVELLDGTLYTMSPQHSRHFVAKNEICFRLRLRLRELGLPLDALVEPTVAIGKSNAPEPDIVLAQGPYGEGFAPVECVKLAIEVSSTTLKTDLGFKKTLYAGAGIPEYWVLDVEARCFHLFSDPVGEDYRQSQTFAVGHSVESTTISGLILDSTGIV